MRNGIRSEVGNVQKKRIDTARIQRWKKIDRLSWLIPLAVLILFLVINEMGRALIVEVFDDFNPLLWTGALVIILFTVAATAIPMMLIWRVVSRSIKKSVIKNATYSVTEDFDYYREKLSGLSPTTISMLTDLQIETKKDVTALLLQYTMLGVISFDDSGIRVVNMDHPQLMPSDKLLLHLVAYRNITDEGLDQWRDLASKEVLEQGYLTDIFKRENVQKEAGKKLAQGCLGGCLLPIVLTAILAFGVIGIIQELNYEEYLENAPVGLSASESIEYVFADSSTQIGTLVLLGATVGLTVIAVLPVVTLAWMIMSSVRTRWLRRTEEGEVLTQQIAGMKNFIHDFTNLSEAEKEALLVWDDFLVYAVVLEENESIVEEIFRMKNFNYARFNIFS